MKALRDCGTWDLQTLPQDKEVVRCRWVFTIKYHLDGTIEQLKARLVVKGYTQTYGVDYIETFSLVTRLNFVKSCYFFSCFPLLASLPT